MNVKHSIKQNKTVCLDVAGQLERPQGRELVLDYIIERKRMDDLVGSCIDGRFKEQKVRTFEPPCEKTGL